MNDNGLENFQDELDTLKKIDLSNRRAAFLDYCKKVIGAKEKGEININEASHRICGVCSIFFEQIMPEFNEVMNIACDLELPDNHRERGLEDWEILKRIINDTA